MEAGLPSDSVLSVWTGEPLPTNQTKPEGQVSFCLPTKPNLKDLGPTYIGPTIDQKISRMAITNQPGAYSNHGMDGNMGMKVSQTKNEHMDNQDILVLVKVF